MKKSIILHVFMLTIISLCYRTVRAQEYRVDLASGTLKFNEISDLSIEGYDGNEVIITYSGKIDKPERAKGLKPINSLGIEDNTGLGLSVISNGDVMEVQQISRQDRDGYYQVKVPANVKVQVSYTGVHGDEVKIKNLQNELEVSTRHNDVFLENISGASLINTVHGSITASFTALQPDNPISMVSIHNEVDVSLPAEAQADLLLASQYGTIYTDMDIRYAKTSGEMRRISSEIEGTLNGGGTKVVLKSNHNNVYLRKK